MGVLVFLCIAVIIGGAIYLIKTSQPSKNANSGSSTNNSSKNDSVWYTNYLKKQNQELSKENERLKAKVKSLDQERQTPKYVHIPDHNHADTAASKDQQIAYLNTTIKNLSNELEMLKKKNENLRQENGGYIKENQELTEMVHQFNPYDDYRKRFPSPYRCDDGDWVRSKAEREIDNFFYKHRIWHIIEEAYYKKNSNIQYYPDFYLPDYNLYLEYFGGTDTDYLFKKESKIATYRSDPSIRFEYLTFQDDSRIEERLREICRKYSIPL